MRYTHNLKILRKRKHAFNISIAITVLLFFLIIFLGFTELDARLFFFGFFESLTRVSTAYVVSLLIATVFTLIISSNPAIEAVSVPILDVLQSFPSFALFPLFVIWFGRNSFVTILILIITMIWPILFTLLSGIKQIRLDLLEAAHLFGATGWKHVLYVLFPLLFPSIVTGSIVAWGEAWEAIIAAEIIVAIPGVGTYLAKSGEGGQSHILLIGIFILLLLLFILNKYLWLPLLNLSTRYQQD